MEKITRFGVSIKPDLLKAFDRGIKKKGYTNRSEAIRDIIRKNLIQERIEDRLKRQVRGTNFGSWDLILKVAMVAVIVIFGFFSFKLVGKINTMNRLDADNTYAYCSNIYAQWMGDEVAEESGLNAFAKEHLMEEFIENEKGESTVDEEKSVFDVTNKVVLGET